MFFYLLIFLLVVIIACLHVVVIDFIILAIYHVLFLCIPSVLLMFLFMLSSFWRRCQKFANVCLLLVIVNMLIL